MERQALSVSILSLILTGIASKRPTDCSSFGGTDGVRWFNDVWTYDPKTNAWTELDCIGYIPTPREGHAAALVNDTMYVFGGRVQEGTDLGDLAAFRISTRRWYMFQNMGPSPSPRSGHSMTAFGKHVVVLAGEPSASPRDPGELSLCYVLDTSKIRYPANDQPQAQQMPNGERAPVRKFSGGDRSAIPQSRGNAPAVREIATASGDPFVKGPEAGLVNGIPNPNSRLPRPGAASGPLPSQQPLQSRSNGVVQAQYTSRARTPPRSSDTSRGPSFERVGSPSANDVRSAQEPTARISPARDQVYDDQLTPNFQQPLESPSHDQLFDTIPSNVPPSRSGSRSTRQHTSLSSIEQLPSVDRQRSVSSREIESRPIDSGVGSSPALSQQNDDLLKELEAAKSRNAWYASELALARKSGYQTSASNSLVLDERGVDTFGEDDRPLLEALLKMRAELAKVQDSIDDRAVTAANRITEVEKQRDAAINEAVYARAKLAAQGGSQAGTPQPDSSRNMGTPDIDRVNDLNKRLASSLATQNELTSKLDALVAELDAERRARSMAEETAEAAQKRVSELDSYRQHNASEVESLRAELYEAQRIAREEAASSAEVRSAHRLLEVDKNELATKHAKAVEHAKTHSTILQTLRDAVTASSDKASLLERRLDGEKHRRDSVEQRLAQLKLEHENRTVELETATRRLRETEELAEKHAAEANLHRQAVLSGLGKVADTDEDEHEAADQRVTILQQQVEAAHTMIRKYQTAADTASDKLRRAEERIAGLETYQEQTSRESLTIRKQLQSAMKEVQTLQTERAELQQQLERQQLESNAIEVQLKTLKNLLEERGISAADVRRSRGLDSPSLQTRFSTPEMTRVRDLEQQLEASIKAHDELRSTFEQREQAVSRDWEEKLAALENDHQAAVKYVRGIEKMLAKMKQELQRTKHTNLELEKELAQEKSAAATRTTEQEAAAEWEAERESLRAEITEMQESVKTSVSQLESQIQTLKSSLDASEREREVLQQSAMQTQQSHQRQREELEAATTQTRADLEHLRHENTLLEERARDAERKVQLFLDQFESSVDNYRRMSQMTPTPHSANGSVVGRGHRHTASGGSIYSTISDTTDATNSPTTNDQASDDEDGDATPNGLHHGFAAQAGLGALIGHSRDRSSIALDSLASELDALRSQWETTNKNYRMSDRLDFESTPTSEGGDVSESLASWRKRLDFDDEEKEGGKNDEGRSGEAGKEKVNGVSGSVGVIAGGNVSGEGGAA